MTTSTSNWDSSKTDDTIVKPGNSHDITRIGVMSGFGPALGEIEKAASGGGLFSILICGAHMLPLTKKKDPAIAGAGFP